MRQGAGATRIALDAMGGDLGPEEIVRGAALFLRNHPGAADISLVGDEAVLRPLLRPAGLEDNPRFNLVHASEVIGMDEKPIQSLKHKKDASLVRAIGQVKEGACDAALSCGNTGSLMACGILTLRTMEGVERPALGSFMPDRQRGFILLDIGANHTAKPEHLVHYAILGGHYARIVLGLPAPRVGLLSIGTEESKGNELILETHQMLKNTGDLIRYEGLIEGFQVFDNAVDVIICDGFVGNVIIKTCKSLYRMMQSALSSGLKKNPLRMGGALLARGAFSDLKKQLNPDQFGAAPLLGLRGNVFKAHGSSNRHAISHGLRIASEIVVHEMNRLAENDIAAANASMKAAAPNTAAVS